MGLHRLFWIPEGASARQGIYVQYNAPEQYAILCLESARHHCALAGEDLGVVPDYVRPAMREHGMSRLHVDQFSLPSEPGQAITAPPAEAIASLNTHDTPTLHGYRLGRDIDDQLDMGLITQQEAATLREGRAQTLAATVAYLRELGLLPARGPSSAPSGGSSGKASGSSSEVPLADIMRALTEHMGRSDAHMVLVTLEDLWLEPAPQNVPGTGPPRPHWRRKLSRLIDDFGRDDAGLDVLRALDHARRTADSPARERPAPTPVRSPA